MRKILIVGTESYIGTNFENYMDCYTDEYEISTICSINLIPKISLFVGYDIVFFVAGIAHKKETSKNRHLYYKVNRDLAIRTAQSAKKAGVVQFILLSSMNVYGMLTGHITKDTIPCPTSAYGNSKLQADEKILGMQDETFHVAVIRPPMVYGKDCKGNYPLLRKFILRTLFFPNIKNIRSMIYIGNLCEFIKNIIERQEQGVFFPQNAEYVCTTELVKKITKLNGKRMIQFRLLNPLLKRLPIPILKKVFGSLTYEFTEPVDTFSFEESLKYTEGIKVWKKIKKEKNKKTEQKMLVTILTVSFNSSKTIGRTIQSVFNQTYPNIEYIIIDGASSDNTVQIARSFQDQFDSTPGRSLKIVSEPDKGMYDALNKGARLAHGKIIGQINSDDWYEADAVEIMSDLYMQKHYDVAWGSIRIQKPTGDMIKHAKIGKLWTTTGWCHPGMFSKKEILLQYPYACESMYDDFDFITAVYQDKKNIITIDEVISNFSFGGMSTQKSIREVKKRIHILYKVYRKYGMSRLYWFHRVGIEMAKYFLG